MIMKTTDAAGSLATAASLEHLRQFVEQAPAAIAMFDREMRYIACSRRWFSQHGREEHSVAGRSHYEVFPDIPERWKETGGFASIESAPGQGCTVRIYLPREAKEEAVAQGSPRESSNGGKELVLVVEDDDDVREVTRKRLEALGYATIAAETGPDAVEQLKSHESVGLVLSDIVMPGGMSGYDVASWVASNRPGVKVILSSGYNEGDRGEDALAVAPDVVILGKPYTRDELKRALRDAFSNAEVPSACGQGAGSLRPGPTRPPAKHEML